MRKGSNFYNCVQRLRRLAPRRLRASMALSIISFSTILFLPLPAFAQVFDSAGTLCPANLYGYGLVARTVHCLQWTILGVPGGPPGAVDAFLIPLSNAVATAVAAVCTLAVLFFGLKMIISGQQQQHRLTGEGVTLAIKLGIVTIFSYNFGGMLPTLMQITTEMMNTVSQYMPFTGGAWCTYDVWQSMDCALDRLIGGILPGSTLVSGALGFFAGLLPAGGVGFSIALMGGWLVVFMVNAIFKSVYVYLSAIIGITFMALISPILVPCLLFQNSRPYFEKWLRLMIGLMLQPIFLAAYVSMLLIAFELVVLSGPQSLYAAIVGTGSLNNPDYRIGNELALSSAYGETTLFNTGLSVDPGEVGWQLQNSPNANTGVGGQQAIQPSDAAGVAGQIDAFKTDNNQAGFSLPVNTISLSVLAGNLGVEPIAYTINILLTLTQAAVMAYIFYTMQGIIPYLGNAISGGVAGGITSLPNLGAGYDQMVNKIGERMRGGGSDVQTAARGNVPGVGRRPS